MYVCMSARIFFATHIVQSAVHSLQIRTKKNICLFWVNFFVISKENSYVHSVKNLLKSNLQQQIDGILTNLNKMLVKFYDSSSILSSINLLL